LNIYLYDIIGKRRLCYKSYWERICIRNAHTRAGFRYYSNILWMWIYYWINFNIYVSSLLLSLSIVNLRLIGLVYGPNIRTQLRWKSWTACRKSITSLLVGV